MRWLVEQVAGVPHTARIGRDLRRLALLALALSALSAVAISRYPPIHGDAYEYASIARSIVRTGTLTETHLRGYHFEDTRPLELPHAGAHRAGLHALLLVPSQLVFGDSWHTIVAPHLLAVAALPFAIYLGALPLFSRRIAFRTAWLVPLFPRVLFYAGMEDAGLPDWPHWCLLTVVPGMLLHRRYGRAGVIVGLATLLKSSALLVMPAWFAWALLMDRRRLTDPRWLLLPLAFLVTLSPYGIRNMLAFGQPIYSEDVGRWAEEPPEKSISMQHMLEPLAGGPFRPDDVEVAASEGPFPTTVQILAFGRHSDHGYYPGFPGLLGWPFVPFFLLGLWAIRGSPRRLLGAFVGVVHGSVFVLFLMVEDRYLFPILAPAVAISLEGLEVARRRWPRLKRQRVIVFFLLTETVPLLIGGVERDLRGGGRAVMMEFEAIGEVIREETGPDDVLMTVPFWSPHYLYDRMTVPFPWADVATVRRIVSHYEVRALILDHRMLPDQVREPAPVESVAEGRYLSLRMLDPERAGRAPEGSPPELEAVNALATYHRDREQFPDYPSLPWTLRGVTGSRVAAVLLYAVIATLWLLMPLGRRVRWLVLPLVPLVVHVGQLVALVRVSGNDQAAQRPRINDVQIAAVVGEGPAPVADPELSARLHRLVDDVGLVLEIRSVQGAGCVALLGPAAERPLLLDTAAVHAARQRNRAEREVVAASGAALEREGVRAHVLGEYLLVPVGPICED